MKKYYELTINLSEEGLEKTINEVSEIDNETIIMNQLFIDGLPSVFRISINTFNEPNFNDYLEQIKATISEYFVKQKDEINKLLEATSCEP